MTVRDLIIALTGQTLVTIHDIFSTNEEARKVIKATPALMAEEFAKYNERTVVLFQPSSAEHIDIYI